MVGIKVLDWLWSPDHAPARFDVRLAVAPPLIVVEEPLGGEGGMIHLSIPLHWAARTSVAGEHIFKVLVSDSEARAEVADRRGVAGGVGHEGVEARGVVGRGRRRGCHCLRVVEGVVGVGGAEL